MPVFLLDFIRDKHKEYFMHIETGKVKKHYNILSNASKGLIDGVFIKELKVFPDDRGFFSEIFRTTDKISDDFQVLQSSLTMTRENVIKAFHYHLHQTDIFLPIIGTAKITLVDIRKESPTHLIANSIVAGEYYLKAVKIPNGIIHGYEVLPDGNMTMVYFTDKHYNPEDEYRIPYDSEEIGFKWWGIENR